MHDEGFCFLTSQDSGALSAWLPKPRLASGQAPQAARGLRR